MNTDNIVQRIWGLCHILRGDGVSYHEYISELTYLLFLKIAEENKTENLIPSGRRWSDLVEYKGPDLLNFYREMLTYLERMPLAKRFGKFMLFLQRFFRTPKI